MTVIIIVGAIIVLAVIAWVKSNHKVTKKTQVVSLDSASGQSDGTAGSSGSDSTFTSNTEI